MVAEVWFTPRSGKWHALIEFEDCDQHLKWSPVLDGVPRLFESERIDGVVSSVERHWPVAVLKVGPAWLR